MNLQDQLNNLKQNLLSSDIVKALLIRGIISIILSLVCYCISIFYKEYISATVASFTCVAIYCSLWLFFSYKTYSEKFLLLCNHLILIIDLALFICIILFASPYKLDSLYFGSINIAFVILICIALFHGNSKYILFSSVLVAVSHFLLQYYNRSFFIIKFPLLENQISIINFFFYSVFYLIIGGILYFKFNQIQKGLENVQSVTYQKIISGVLNDLQHPNGEYEIGKYKIFINYEYSSNQNTGADYVGIKELKDGFLLIVGDVISHGINVSQGAIVCLSTFYSAYLSDPRIILKDLNRVLLKVNRNYGGESLALIFRFYNDGRVHYNGSLESFHIEGVDKKLKEIVPNEFIIGKEDQEIDQNKELKLKIGQSLIVTTDGAKYSDLGDDRTTVTIEKI